LRAAAQAICLRLLKTWRSDNPPADTGAVDELVRRAKTDDRLRPEAVREQIEREAVRGPEGGPADQIERGPTGLEGHARPGGRRSEAGPWSRAVWEQARDLIGTRPTGEQDSSVRRSRLSKLLEESIRRVADAWANEFAASTRHLEEHPGHR